MKLVLVGPKSTALILLAAFAAFTPTFASDENSWEAFTRLQGFGEINLTGEEPAAESIPAGRNPGRPDLEFTNGTSTLLRLILAGSHRQTFELIQTICRRIGQEKDGKDWMFTISSSPYANAFFGAAIAEGKSYLWLTLGMFGLFETVDEMAGVIAHEMSHGNKEFDLRIPANKKIDEIIELLTSKDKLTQSQREEVRADLGAVERMIQAGYNPWAYYRLQKKLAERTTQTKKLLTKVFEKLLRRDLSFHSTHPPNDLRTTYIKGYIARRGYSEDLSNLTNSEEPLPLALKTVKLRALLYSAPVDAAWTRKSLAAAVAAAGIVYATQVSGSVAGEQIGSWARFAWDSAMTGLLYTTSAYVGWIGFRIAQNNFRSSELHTLKGLRQELGKLILTLSAIEPGSPAAAAAIAEALKQSSKTLHHASNQLRSGTLVKLLAPISGLSSLLRQTLGITAGLIKMIAPLPVSAEVQAALEDLPAFALQDRAVLDALKALPESAFTKDLSKNTYTLLQRKSVLEQIDFWQEQNAPGEWLRILPRLTELGLKERAEELLLSKGRSILEHYFSPANQGQVSDRALIVSLSSLVTSSTDLAPRPLATSNVDPLLVDLAKAFRRKSTEERLAFISLTLQVAYQGMDRQNWDASNSDWARKAIKARVSNIRELHDYLLQLKAFRASLPGLTDIVHELVVANPNWIQSDQDIELLLGQQYFWPVLKYLNGRGAFFHFASDNLEKLRSSAPEFWKFKVGASEELQSIIVQRMKALGTYPSEPHAKFRLWSALLNCGITAVTDSIFAELFESPEPSIKQNLIYTGQNGFVWDPGLKAKIAEIFVRNSVSFQSLVKGTAHPRMPALEQLILVIQKAFPARDVAYERMLESVSWAILASEEESRVIHEAKLSAIGGEQQQDLGIRFLSVAIEEIHDWKFSEQWEFIRFLRGEIAASPKIRETFSITGPERIRRLFLDLPLEARALVLDSLLDSSRGLLGNKGTRQAWPKRIIHHLLKGAEPSARSVSQELLMAFLHSLEATGNSPLQSYVLGYILSMPKEKQGDTGEILKNVLELFGATGIKIGQFLVAAGLLPEKDSKTLRTLQERAKEPTREGLYQDKRDIFGEKELPWTLGELKGSASLKYALEAKDRSDGSLLILKVLRLESVAHTELEFKQLQAMAEYLHQNYGPKYGVFRSIVRASREAVTRELKLSAETRNSKLIWDLFYSHTSEPGITVKVPEEFTLNARTIASRFAPGTSIFELPPDVAAIAANKIMRMEMDNLFRAQDTIVFDPDRHPGNYRIHFDRDTNHLVIHPIDFGQVVIITAAQRENILNLFAVAQILRASPSYTWSVDILQSMLQLPPQKASQLKRALQSYFPDTSQSEVTAYFSLLAALEDAGEPLPIEYFDFIRAIVQLKQYEELGTLEEEAPSRRLADEIRGRTQKLLAGLKLSLTEKAMFACRSLLQRAAQNTPN